MFLERERRGERKRGNIDEREKHQLVAAHIPPPKDGIQNLDRCPNMESNPKTSGVWTTLQPTEPFGHGTPMLSYRENIAIWLQAQVLHTKSCPFEKQKAGTI